MEMSDCWGTHSLPAWPQWEVWVLVKHTPWYSIQCLQGWWKQRCTHWKDRFGWGGELLYWRDFFPTAIICKCSVWMKWNKKQAVQMSICSSPHFVWIQDILQVRDDFRNSLLERFRFSKLSYARSILFDSLIIYKACRKVCACNWHAIFIKSQS